MSDSAIGKHTGNKNGRWVDRVEWKCPECGCTKMIKQCRVNKIKYCSRKCYYSAIKSKETRDKISEANSGKKNGMYGSNRLGKDNPNWQGGITDEDQKQRNSIEMKEWREKVFKRDNYTCQKYKTRGGQLHPHHIKNFAQYPDLRLNIDNGVTLSEKAHKEFHRIYGIKNNNIKQLSEFLNL